MAIAIVQGVFSVRPEDRDRFIEQSVDGIRSARSEEGCLEYVFAADPIDPGRVILSERWESIEALDRHLQRSAGTRTRPDPEPEIRAVPLSREIVIYEVASSRPLG